MHSISFFSTDHPSSSHLYSLMPLEGDPHPPVGAGRCSSQLLGGGGRLELRGTLQVNRSCVGSTTSCCHRPAPGCQPLPGSAMVTVAWGYRPILAPYLGWRRSMANCLTWRLCRRVSISVSSSRETCTSFRVSPGWKTRSPSVKT